LVFSRYLNVVELDNNETPAQCMERIETVIAQDLEIKTTKFTSRDKVSLLYLTNTIYLQI